MIQQGQAPVAQELGGEWVWNATVNKCLTSLQMMIATAPQVTGACTQVGYVADNPGFTCYFARWAGHPTLMDASPGYSASSARLLPRCGAGHKSAAVGGWDLSPGGRVTRRRSWPAPARWVLGGGRSRSPRGV